MFLSHNAFTPQLVIEEIQRRQDIPEVDLLDIYHFLKCWFENWLEGDIEEDDNLIDLLFGGIVYANIETIEIYPIHSQTILIEDQRIGFPLITIKVF